MKDAVMVRAEFTLPDGTVLTKDWKMSEAGPPGVTMLKAPPSWLLNARRAWDHPQGPITFRGDVAPGHEDEARAMLGALRRWEEAAEEIEGCRVLIDEYEGALKAIGREDIIGIAREVLLK